MTSEVVAGVPVPVPGRAQRVREIAAELRGLRGALIPILHAVQKELEYVAQDDVAVIADVLNLSVAEVHGVVTFYKDPVHSPSTSPPSPASASQASSATAA